MPTLTVVNTHRRILHRLPLHGGLPRLAAFSPDSPVAPMRLSAVAAIAVVLALITGSASAQATLQRNNGDDPDTLDPQRATTAAEASVLYDLYEGLLTYDAGGNIIPGAAVEWAISDDRLTYTFSLREAHWSDGSEVTAEDFRRGLSRLLDPATAAPDARLFSSIEGAAEVLAGDADPESIGVSAPDTRTLEIRLVEPNPMMLHLLALPAAMPAHRDLRIIRSWPQATTPFNGPYRYDGFVSGRGLWLIANEDFHAADSIAFDTVIHRGVAADVALGLFADGTLQTSSNVPALLIDTLSEQYPEQLHVARFAGTYFLATNVDGALADRSLRRAVALAIDRIALAEETWQGLMIPTLALVPAGVDDLPNPTEAGLGPNDPDARLSEAITILAAAGFDENNPLELTLAVASGGVSAATAGAIAADLVAAGIRVTLVERPADAHNRALLDDRDYDIAVVGWIGRLGHADEFLSLFEEGPTDVTGYRNPDVQSLLAEARLTADRTVRSALYAAADRQIAADLPAIPLLHFASFNLVSTDITGWLDNPIDLHPSRWLMPAPEPAAN